MKKILTALFLIVANSIAFGQIKLTEYQISKLDSIANQDVPKDAPGIATAIIQDGKVIYEKYAGYANLTDSTLIKDSTRFNIASNGKQFTALAILTLIDENKLELSDDIRNWFPDLYSNIEEKITVRNLLNHTSGIRDCYELWSLQGYTWWEKSFDNNDVLRLIEKQTDLNFVPNSKYLYSNTNYILLALIVEKVSKKSFSEYTNEMFKQLNMSNTSFESDYTNIRGQIARPYFNFGTWTTYDWIWNVVGDGNIFSTLEDQIQWEKLVQGKGKTTFNRKLIARGQQPIENSKFKNYGYGLEFSEYKDMVYTFHEGATGAWKATVIRFPERNISMVTLTNTGKSIPSIQTRQMADVVFNLKDNSNYVVTKPVKIGAFVDDDEILGVYLTANNFSFEFKKKENGNIVLSRIGRGETELVREADNIFQQKYDPAFKQEFTKNDKGEMMVTAYYTSHAPYSLTRTKADWNNYDYNKINGKFENKETNVEFSIKHDTNKNYKVILNGQENNGVLVTPHKLLVNNYVIEFTSEKNDILSFILNSDRIKNVKFKRKM